MNLQTASNAKLEILSEFLGQNLDGVISALNIKARLTNTKYYGACPVHGGNNRAGWNLYINESEGTPIWKCRTHHCEQKYKKTILGLIHGVLNYQHNNTISFNDAIKWAVDFLGINLNTLEIKQNNINKHRFIQNIRYFTKTEPINTQYITRDRIRQTLKIPAKYYLNKGFNQSILDHYDVGLCDNPNKAMYNRIVVPVYDDNYKFMVGCTARSIFDKCLLCDCYHRSGECITNPTFYDQSKWINNNNFNASWHLYNYWFAKKSIKDTGVAILVEGQADVWKMVQAGINNVVGIFGSTLNDEQLLKIEKSGALSLVILTDNDKAGREAAQNIKKQCNRLYRLYFPKYGANDIGELQTDIITSDIKPIIQKIQELC